ncbi:MAG TPA: response regulator [Thermoanaerobaculia bacterium]|nr:response regulator [Thermoanaerobaculia bacterium]
MASESSPSVLIVDDSGLDRELLGAYLHNGDYELHFAADGVEAMELLDHEPGDYDAVLLDRSMPRMGGMEVLARIKDDSRLCMLPVIFQTAAASPNEIAEGIRAGAYYYLTKPFDAETLQAVVRTATRDYAQYKALQRKVRRGIECLTLVQSATLLIRTVEQARDTAAVFVNACPDPEQTVIGLTELLVNAVEHGNLGITYDEKTALNGSGGWEEEVRRRLALPEHATKRVELTVERTATELRFTIRDEGPGFDFRKYLEVHPQRAFDNHGRGIAIARALSFDRVEYRGTGNEVVAVVALRNEGMRNEE